MKTSGLNSIIQIAYLVLAVFFWFPADAADSEKIQAVTKDEKVMASIDGVSAVLDAPVEFSRGIIIQTNGNYTVGEGRIRSLKKGQTLKRNGMLLSTDGSIMPVFDHIIKKDGKMLKMVDGKYSLITQIELFPNDLAIYPEGTFKKGFFKYYLVDGEVFDLNGEAVPTIDAASMRDGKVIVQKSGSMFTVKKNVYLLMNDGTKVFGNGKILKLSGEKIQLEEGQIIELEGPRGYLYGR